MSAPTRTSALALAAAALTLGVVALLVPDRPPAGFRGDGDHYTAMAEHPLDEVAESPYAQRLAVPLVAAALPTSTQTAFLLLSVASLLVASLCVALISRELVLPPVAQVAASALTSGCYVGVHALFIPSYVDPPALAAVAVALLLALRRRWGSFAVALVAGVLVKEVAATLIVVPYLLDERRRRVVDVRAAGRAALVSAPALAAFAAVHAFAPVEPSVGDDLRLSFVDMGIASRGVVTSIGNPVLALFGATALAWPLGLLRAPAVLRRLHVWAALAVPILAFGHMERTLGILVPVVVPAALFAFRGAAPGVLAAFAAGSWWVTAVAGGLTIGPGASSVAEKGALVAPGLALSLGALLVHLRARRPTGAVVPQRAQ